MEYMFIPYKYKYIFTTYGIFALLVSVHYDAIGAIFHYASLNERFTEDLVLVVELCGCA